METKQYFDRVKYYKSMLSMTGHLFIGQPMVLFIEIGNPR